MLEFLREEDGDSSTGAVAAAVAIAVVVVLILVLYSGGFFNRPSEPGIDINIRPGS